MNAAAEKEHARMIEDARQMLNQRIEAAIKEGLNVELTTIPHTVDGQTYPDAHIRLLVLRRIEP